jgi:hypothetical protein
MSDNDVIRLRAHHLLCLQGFQGYGYTKEFIKNLQEIFTRFDSDPDLVIEIITECDDVCTECPYIKDGVCSKEPDSASKMKDMDVRVLKMIKVEEGYRGTADEFIKLVNENLKDINQIQPICGDCEWKKDCLWYLSKVHDF